MRAEAGMVPKPNTTPQTKATGADGGGEPLVNAREISRLLGISERHCWTLTKRGIIPHVRLGHLVRYRWRDVEAMIDANVTGGNGR